MKIHKEGYKIVCFITILFSIITAIIWCFSTLIYLSVLIEIIILSNWIFVIWFFRQPKREVPLEDNSIIYAPADGTIVAIEEVYEDEYLKKKCIQVSIFMSVWNVHMNWYPVAGIVKYYKYHKGKFLVAWLPKSSTENERTTTVIETEKHKILFRQIAGFVARRIINYSKEKNSIAQNQNCGFIKFGSRVDLFIPIDSSVKVKLNDKTIGTKTIIAELP